MNVVKGRRTYFTCGAVIALLLGQWAGVWTIPGEVYGGLAALALAFLRAGVSRELGDPGESEESGAHGVTRPTAPTANTAARTYGVFLFLLSAFCFLFCAGCASTAPTALERKFFEVTTNYIPHVVVVTNYESRTVAVTNTVPVMVYETNRVGVNVLVTNLVPVLAYETNRIAVAGLQTNQEESYHLTPNATARAVAATGGAVSNLAAPGVGGLVVAGIGGLFAIWAGIRNRQFSKQNDLLSQSAGVLAQGIETAREVLKSTPQGAEASDRLTAWMVSHQAETGTIAAITGIVRDATDNEEAKRAAAEILALMNRTAKV